MKIAIIGSGNMGSGLGKIWARQGNQILFSYSRNRAKLEALAGSVPNARTAEPAEAAALSDAVLLAVPWSIVPEALAATGPLEGKVLIDCTNPLLPDLSGLAVGQTTSGGEEIAKIARGARTVKAFNTAFAEIYQAGSRLFGSRQITMFYCGDAADAKEEVSRLITQVGFVPVDAGSLSASRYLEPLAMLMIQLAYKQGFGTRMAMSLIRR